MRRVPLLAAVLAVLAAAPAWAQDEIVVLSGDTSRPTQAEVEQREDRLGFEAEQVYDRVVDGFAADLTEAQVAELERDPEVAMVVPNRPVSKALAVAAPAPSTVPPGGVISRTSHAIRSTGFTVGCFDPTRSSASALAE